MFRLVELSQLQPRRCRQPVGDRSLVFVQQACHTFFSGDQFRKSRSEAQSCRATRNQIVHVCNTWKILRILAYMAFCEVSQDQSPGTPAAAGDFGFKVLTSSDPAEKTKKLPLGLQNATILVTVKSSLKVPPNLVCRELEHMVRRRGMVRMWLVITRRRVIVPHCRIHTLVQRSWLCIDEVSKPSRGLPSWQTADSP